MRPLRSIHTSLERTADAAGRYASTPFRENEKSGATPSASDTAFPEVLPEAGSNRWASSVPPLVEIR